jgi:hypothetical protein
MLGKLFSPTIPDSKNGNRPQLLSLEIILVTKKVSLDDKCFIQDA